MNFIVKNTTRIGLIDLICPYTCRGCGRLGTVLCECCRNDILRKQKAICPLCKNVVAEKYENVGKCCMDCDSGFEEIWVGSWREGVVAKMVAEYKYKSMWACGVELMTILDNAIPVEALNGFRVVVVPLPTIGRHVRERGLDHTWQIGKKLAKRRGWVCQRILLRATDTVQVGAQLSERRAQAKKAYTINDEIDPEIVYVLLDDVWTTGASMLAALKVMRDAGARHVYGAAVAVSKDKVSDDKTDCRFS